MADNISTETMNKIDAAAERLAAEKTGTAAAAGKVDEKTVAKAVEAGAPKGEVKPAVVAKAVAAPAKAPVKKTPKKTPKKAAKKSAASKTAAKTAARKATPRQAGARKPVAAAASTATNPIARIKETIMTKTNTTDFTKTAKQLAEEAQARLATTFAKSSEVANDLVEFNKANAQALLESGKVLVSGAQELVREQVEATRKIVETVTEDAKKMTSVKSPTELFQFQGELARRNIDAAVSFGAKRAERLVKLYGEALAPIASRVSVAAEKIRKSA